MSHQMPLGKDQKAHFLQGPYSRHLVLTPQTKMIKPTKQYWHHFSKFWGQQDVVHMGDFNQKALAGSDA